MAPEVVSGSAISSSVIPSYLCDNAQADLWSLGITALELYKGFPPLARFETREIFARILQGEAPSFDSYYDVYKANPSSAFQSFIEKVLVKQPEERATAEDLEDHRWFQGAEEGRAELLKLLEKIPDIEEDPVFDLRLDLWDARNRDYFCREAKESEEWDFSCVCADPRSSDRMESDGEEKS